MDAAQICKLATTSRSNTSLQSTTLRKHAFILQRVGRQEIARTDSDEKIQAASRILECQ
jgi:hypothetical protein